MPIKVSKFLLSYLLTGILMLPYWCSFSHLFEGHDHKTCDISETHFHGIELDCDILEYQFASSTEISNENNCNIILSFNQIKTSFFYLGFSYSIINIDTLRGPPLV
jgi:hypothetical protein